MRRRIKANSAAAQFRFSGLTYSRCSAACRVVRSLLDQLISGNGLKRDHDPIGIGTAH